MKKKVLIVDCNAKIGGIQKSLVSLLKQIHDSYEITLLLLNRDGELLKEIPSDVRILTTKSDFCYMGMAQADCSRMIDKAKRAFYVLLSRVFGQRRAVNLASLTLWKDNLEEYDIAISFSHVAGAKLFYGGTAEYVLRMGHESKKVCYIHCDYLNSGTRSKYSDSLYAKFDRLVCVSASTRERFLEALPNLSGKVISIENAIDSEQIFRMAHDHPFPYNGDYINLLTVARLSAEKGVARFISVLSKINCSGLRYYIVGDGRERKTIERMIAEYNLSEHIILLGEDKNPYRYMLNADLLVVPSYHEAAPVVFQEAKVLGLPVLTTRTTSADEMIGETYGFVVGNNEAAIVAQMHEILAHPKALKVKKQSGREVSDTFKSDFKDAVWNIN